MAGKLGIVVIFTFRSVFKRKLSKILDMPISEVARSLSSFTLSFDLISRHQNKRFYDIEIVWRLGSTDDTPGGEKRRPKICLRSQASEPAVFVSFIFFVFIFIFHPAAEIKLNMYCNTHLTTKTDNKKRKKKKERKERSRGLNDSIFAAAALKVNHLVSNPARHGLP